LVPSEKELFADLPEQPAPEAPGRGMPRLRQPERHQLGWQVATIDDLVARDHPVRAVWAFVQGLDLRALHDTVKAREGVPGQAPPAPELMMALWLWATVDGVGSARQLARLCEQHLAYRWLCGGVSMNYHSLSDFRVAHAAVLDRLLAGGVAALVAQGVVALDVLAQHGLRVRAAAGAGSFRRRERLVELAAAATARVEQLRGELDADPAAGDRRQRAAHRRAAQQRAAREGEERVKAALDRMSELEAERTRREKTNKAEVMLRSARRARLEARPPRWSSAFAALNQFSDRLEKPVPTTKVDPGLCRESAKAISSCIN
jgi:transposase